MRTNKPHFARNAMTIIERLLGKDKEEENPTEPVGESRERVRGKITKIEDEEGWGFISSKDIPFTRIFFHWTGLNQSTLRFPELRKGMVVEFEPLEVEGKGVRAIRISVVEE